MRDSYLSIARPQRTELRIKRSRFTATVLPAASRPTAERGYRAVQRQFYDASHNCFAFQIGVGATVEFRYSDDGEPSGTAGRQIYDTICACGVTNLLLVVSRYFGGIKLGSGGLARAYRDSARQVLAEAEIVEKLIKQHFRVTYDHDQTAIAMKILSDFELAPLETEYGAQVVLTLAIRAGRYQAIRKELIERSHGRIDVAEV